MSLTLEERGELRYLIEREIREIEERLRAAGAEPEDVAPDAAIGRLSRLDALVNKGTKDMALGAQARRLGLLRETLGRLSAPDFGRCGLCGGAIPVERLLAAPESSVCVPCLEKSR